MDKALQTMIDNMPEKTGKSLKEWQKILSTNKFDKHSLAVKFLKEQHGVTHGFANTIVSLSKNQSESPEDLIVNQYKEKPLIKPIYEELQNIIEQFGSDVVLSPKKASVSFIRKNQFALIKPATKKRVDLGLKLKGVTPQGCLEDSGPFGTMCTHRIQLTDLTEINEEVKAWLLQAYESSI